MAKPLIRKCFNFFCPSPDPRQLRQTISTVIDGKEGGEQSVACVQTQEQGPPLAPAELLYKVILIWILGLGTSLSFLYFVDDFMTVI